MFGWLKRLREKWRASAEQNWFVSKCSQSDLACDECGGRLPPSAGVFGKRGGACCPSCRIVWCRKCQPGSSGVDLMNVPRNQIPNCPKCNKRMLFPL